jgi:hypothetical protein
MRRGVAENQEIINGIYTDVMAKYARPTPAAAAASSKPAKAVASSK